MNNLEYIQNKFQLDLNQRKMPIAIPNFGRNQLALLLYELKLKIGVEVGVAAGEYSLVLARNNPQMDFFGVDPYAPQKGYRDYTRGATFNKLEEEAHKRLEPYPNYSFIKTTSLEALDEFDDNSLDFVYIDADHSFTQVAQDVHYWYQKVKPGFILAGHDYAFTKGNARMHVKHVLPAYTAAWGIRPWFVLGNEANNEGLIRDPSRSWLIVKP